MNGVEILSSVEVVAETTCNWWLAGFIYLVVLIAGGFIGFHISDNSEKVSGAVIGVMIFALIGLFVFAFISVLTQTPTAYETHYKVTIDDSVSMNEFLDKYEILDQEGKIYTVKERE